MSWGEGRALARVNFLAEAEGGQPQEARSRSRGASVDVAVEAGARRTSAPGSGGQGCDQVRAKAETSADWPFSGLPTNVSRTW